MANLELFLLGSPQIYVDGQEITDFNTRKDRALLAYLAVTGTMHSREALAGLLWSELPEDKARRNLRHTLSHLQRVIGPQWLAMERGVALTKEQPWSVDVHTLRSAVKSLDSRPPVRARYNETQELDRLIRVLNLYRGEFLQGFYIHHAAYFEEWVMAQREETRNLTLRGLEVLVERCLAQGDYDKGLAATHRLIQLEPWSEMAHRLQMKLLAQSGRRTDALAQYERCRQTLAAELGVEPLPETTALYQQIQAGKYNWPGALNQLALPVPPSLDLSMAIEPAPAKSSVPNNLPNPLASFVGRQTELDLVSLRLRAADCRLLTIIGPGGMGKTSLALALGGRLLRSAGTDFPDGIFWVPLADVGTAGRPAHLGPAVADDPAAGEAILRAIALQLGYQLAGGIASMAQLQAYLHSRQLLLILDNFEHLLAGVDALVTLLTKAPQLKVVVTSRARLNVRGESVLSLDKLSLPPVADHTGARISPDEGWQTSEAVAMFVQRAQQFDPTFAISAATRGPVGQICHLVEGLPLGIELATSMLPLVSCETLAQELAKGLDFLATDMRDVPAEQRTLGAVFERSWRLLPPDGQQLLARLAIFPGSFGRDAAERIVGASSRLLRRLLDQSLLNKVGDDRYTMHRTVHTFAVQKLHQTPEQIAALHVAYAHDYLAWLAQREADLTETAYAQAAGAIQTELDNVHTAWRRAVAHHLYAALDRGLNAIFLFYEQQGFYLDSMVLYEDALLHFGAKVENLPDPSTTNPELFQLLGGLQTHLARCNVRLGRFAQAQAGYELAWSILQQVDSPSAAAACLALWGASIRGSHPQRSVELLTEALRLAQTSGVVWMQVLVSQSLGEMILLVGDYATAKAHITAGYRLAQQHHRPRGLTSGAKSLGRVNLALGHYQQAEAHLREAVGLAHHHHLKVLGLESMLALGEALRLQGRLAESSACLAESRRLAAVLGPPEFMAPILWEEGCLAEQSGAYAAAKAYFNESLAIGLPIWWSHALPTLGWALIGLGEWEEAQRYFQKVLTTAEARLPISLDAQAGLAAITALWASAGQTRVEASSHTTAPVATILQVVYQHPAATQETQARVAKLATALGISLLDVSP